MQENMAPVEKPVENQKKWNADINQNELRAMSGAMILIIIIALIVAKNDGNNYNHIILLLSGFFVGGSLLTNSKSGQE